MKLNTNKHLNFIMIGFRLGILDIAVTSLLIDIKDSVDNDLIQLVCVCVCVGGTECAHTGCVRAACVRVYVCCVVVVWLCFEKKTWLAMQ